MEKNPFSLKIKITHLNRKMNTDPIIRPHKEWIFARLNSTEVWNLTLQVSHTKFF